MWGRQFRRPAPKRHTRKTSESLAGSTAFMSLAGFTASHPRTAEQLNLVITDQNNAVVVTSAKTVSRGGDHFVLSSTFTVPTGTKQVCAKMVLEIGPAVLTTIPTDDLQPCMPTPGR